ncbi:MAG: septation protein IspZ [Gammaproteobacteria bacterium]|nr:septation protein IspZ [Gammaproteobacteria bacterium]MCW8987172.1 septation protein IspZ [Gammaproteobacteria bacterium]MCW9031938.1 septation protein IspZ [Gammaproteobacteria bacterium]
MKFLFDFFPIALFFIFYKLYGIYAATIVAIVAAIAQNAFYYLRHKKFETMHLITLAAITILGGLTLFFQNKTFIMWKPTAVYWIIAIAFILSQLVYKKPLIKKMMGSIIDVPDKIWRNANYGMSFGFILFGIINIYVANLYFKAESLIVAKSNLEIKLDNCATYYTGELIQLCNNAKIMEEQWVNFKLFWMLGLTFVLMALLTAYLYKYATNKDDDGSLINAEND